MSKILVIDDDRLVLEYINEVLTEFGHEVAFVPKPIFATKRLEKSNFDLLLIDINMPEINGIELLQIIKSNDQWKSIPVIMMTGDGDSDTLSKCFEFGASDYIEKPVNPIILKARVQAILKAQELNQALIELKEQEALQYKLRSLISQMNPHFIFNVLNSIQYHVLEENKEVAIESISQFSKLIRTSLNHADKDLIALKQEIDFLTTYLHLETERFKGKLFYELTFAENIDIDDTMLPPMLLQPFIENAIVHGIGNKEEKGSIKIHFEMKDKIFQCEIEDDGVGREKASEYKKLKTGSYESKGMGLTEVRMQMLNNSLGKGFSAVIHDLVLPNGQAEGTRVIISMPFISEWEGSD
ncbi:MAG: DNA-binding response OmpR family regulator [Parvicellaceae bacterium]|jgi:DNA-binding response OmpR family regulator